MRRLCLPLLLLATPALAETDVRQAVIDVATASGCVITDAIAEASFPPMGLTQDMVGPVVEEMILAGEGELIDNEFHLAPGLCTGVVEVTPVEPYVPPVSPLMARVIGVFHANGCSMTEENGLPAFAAAGITEADLDTLQDESQMLSDAGLFVFDAATSKITVMEPLCSNPVVGGDPAQPLIDMLSDNGCALTQAAAGALIGDYGITMEAADEMADGLMDRGLAHTEGELLVLNDCGE